MIARGVVVFVAFAALGFGSQAIAEDAPAKGSPNAAPAEQQDRVYLGNEPLESCMKRWDPGTHMTQHAWRESCKRITQERGPLVKNR